MFYLLQSEAGGQRQQLSDGDAPCNRPHKGTVSNTHVVRCTKDTNVNELQDFN